MRLGTVRRLAACLPGLALAAGIAAVTPAAEAASLFRGLLGPDAVVPFPIDRLLVRIGQELAPDAPFGGLPLVLIPLGRSLQRHAAGDADYFRFPRVVVAVTGEPRDTSAPLLRDRLYLGYHEKAAVLEVISYDPAAGRFVFEVVDDYRAGGKARLRRGNRSLCVACHQNDAPLFPRQTWDETSANRSVAALLGLTGRDYYGLDWRRGVDVANAIDDATDRANLLSVAQRLWQTGCGPGAAGRACRAELWWLALRGRFTGLPPQDAEFETPALAPLQQWWRGLQGGLAVPNPDIPNRLPFSALPAEALAHLDASALRRAADVGAPFDALALREPLEHWQVSAPGALARAVAAVGAFLSDADVRALAARTRGGTAEVESEALRCDRQSRGAREDLRCWSGTTLRMTARRTGDRLWVDRLVLPGGMVRYGLAFAADGDDFVAEGVPARTGSGFSLQRLHLAGARLEWSLVDDLAPLAASIRALAVDDGRDAARALSQGVLNRRELLATLLEATDLPAPVAASVAQQPANAPVGRAEPTAPDLVVFFRRCGGCHSDADAYPPDFLHGRETRVRSRLDTCAPRIWQRLQAWGQAPSARAKTPMPPPASAQSGGFAASAELAEMRRFLAARLRAGGQPPEQLDTIAYADLPACASYRP
ncbi:MAG: hypothetical protein KDH20_21175 [Rhodocyclaceae bacterium]|nr:hypothetical protein [Rhodocyclaceae bacterium]